jgi:hypothetical protein
MPEDITHSLLALLFKAALDRDLIQLSDVKARLDRGTLPDTEHDQLAKQIDSALTKIQRFCKRKGWPPLHALYVKQPHCTAGIGFYKSMEFDDKDAEKRLRFWHSCVDAVYSYFTVGDL